MLVAPVARTSRESSVLGRDVADHRAARTLAGDDDLFLVAVLADCLGRRLVGGRRFCGGRRIRRGGRSSLAEHGSADHRRGTCKKVKALGHGPLTRAGG